MSSLRALALIFLVWTGAALSAEAPPSTIAPAPPRGRIVVLGDSITAGFGLADAQEAYPAVLQAKIAAAGLPYEVANAGVSGDTTAGGLRRVDWALSRGAGVLIVALGGNDGLRGIAPKETAANLAGIIDKARAKAPGVEVIVAGMSMPESMGAAFALEFRAVFARVAGEKKALLVPFLLEGVGGVEKLNQADAIHPNAEGQRRVAENVWAVLEPMLTARTAGAN